MPVLLVGAAVAFLSACAPSSQQAHPDVAAPTGPAEEAPAATAASAASAEITASPQTVCELVCERPEVLPRTADRPDYTANQTDDVNRVLEALHPDLMACYTKRLKANPTAHGFITVDMIIGSQGEVAKIDTTGGGILGPATMDCIVKRIRRAKFEPPHGGGTLEVHVPFSLRRVDPGEDSM